MILIDFSLYILKLHSEIDKVKSALPLNVHRMMKKLKILLIDAHPIFRFGLTNLLSQCEGVHLIGQASDGIEGTRFVRELRPDVVFIDIDLPRCNGLDATCMIKTEFPNTKVVIFTDLKDDDYLFEALKCGADGYLLKNIEPNEFVDMVGNIKRGEAAISSMMATKVLHEFSVIKARKNNDSEKKLNKQLSPREVEVLRLVANGKSNKEIGEILVISENTVKNHIRNMLDKLFLENRIQLAVFAAKSDLISRAREKSPPLFGVPH